MAINISKLGLEWSEYTKLTQIPVSENYRADDDGIFYKEYNKKTKEYDEYLISEAISFGAINKDRSNSEEYMEVQFYDYSEGTMKVQKLQIPSRSIGEKEGISDLVASGYNIINLPKFKTFIASVKANINVLTRKGIKNSNTKRFFGSSQYGFEVIDGITNFDNFVGVDNPIMPNPDFTKIDSTLFKTKGTLEGQIEYIDWLTKDSKCEDVWKQVMAISCVSIVKQYLGDSIDCPVYCIVSGSSTGKSFFANEICKTLGMYGKDNTIRFSSDSSLAGLKAMKHRLNVVPVMLDDIQNKISNKAGVEEFKQWMYEHTNGVNTIKANTDRTVSKHNYSWKNALIMFSEKEDLSQLKDGASTRFIMLNTNLKTKSSNDAGGFVTERDLKEVNKRQGQNYGFIFPEFVRKIKVYNYAHNIEDEYIEVANRYAKIMNCTTKDASLYAIIEYTFNLMKEFDLLPKRWEKMDEKVNLHDLETSRVTSSEENLYNIIRDRILDQSSVYINKSIKLKQEDYNERESQNKKVRGRIDIIDYEGKKLKICVIPTRIFDENIVDIQKRNDLTQIKAVPRIWIQNGWLIPDSRGNAQHTATNITREFDKLDDTKKSKENVYKLVLQDLTEKEEDTKEEALESLVEMPQDESYRLMLKIDPKAVLSDIEYYDSLDSKEDLFV